MRSLLALAAAASLVLLSAPVMAAPATAFGAGDTCAPEPCGTLNAVCRKAFHADCVRMAEGSAASAVACMGPVCDAVNAVCWIVLKAWCVG